MTNTHFSINAIGVAKTPFAEKFAVPRQPGLVPSAHCQIELLPPYNREECIRGLEGFSHIWLSFIFHEVADQGWKPMVRPPRLGGNDKIGVFASRSPFRPNGLGLSVVALTHIESEANKVVLHIAGADLVNGTPIVDIKPYVPYADAISDAHGGFAPAEPQLVPVVFEPNTQTALNASSRGEQLKQLITEVLSQKPQPAYQQAPREYGVRLDGCNVRWTWDGTTNVVTSICPIDH